MYSPLPPSPPPMSLVGVAHVSVLLFPSHSVAWSHVKRKDFRNATLMNEIAMCLSKSCVHKSWYPLLILSFGLFVCNTLLPIRMRAWEMPCVALFFHTGTTIITIATHFEWLINYESKKVKFLWKIEIGFLFFSLSIDTERTIERKREREQARKRQDPIGTIIK